MSVSKCFSKFDELGFIYFTFPRINYVNGKKVPMINGPWKNISKENFKEHIQDFHKCVAIICGKPSNITVFDFDTLEAYQEALRIYPDLKKCLSSRTRKGYHVFFRYDSKIKSGTNVFIGMEGVDIRNDDSIIFGPGTKYEFSYVKDRETIVEEFEYKFLLKEISEEDLREVPEELKKKLKQFNEPVKQKFESVKQNDDEIIPKKSEEPEEPEENSDIIKLVNCLSKERATNYDSWIKVGICLKNILGDEGLELFVDFSKKASNFTSDYDCSKKYMKIKEKNEGEKKLEIGSLVMWAKEDCPEEYEKLIIHKKKIIPDMIDTDQIAAKFIKEIAPTKFLWIGTDFYCWTGTRWSTNENLFYKFLSEDSVEELNSRIPKMREDASEDEKINHKKFEKFIKDVVKSWNRKKNQKNIYESCINEMYNEKIKFDNNEYLVGFENGVYDIKEDEFREMRYDDYITLSVGYNYEEINNEKMKELLDVINMILPNKEIRELLLTAYSTGLYGKQVENFIILQSSGRGGKSFLTNLLKNTLGGYILTSAPTTLLTDEMKTGPSPERAVLTNKRIVIMSEPIASKKIMNSNLKLLTGGGDLNGRMLHSNKTEINLKYTLFMECNKKPLLYEEPTVAEMERIIDINFERIFTNDETKIDNVKYFKQNPLLKSEKWLEDHKMEMFYVLKEHFKKFKENGYKFIIPEVIKQRTEAYLQSSIPLVEIFEDIYEKTENIKDHVNLQEVADKMMSSLVFEKMTMREKRLYTKKYIVEFFKRNEYFSKFYCERKRIDGIDFRNILFNFTERNTNRD